MSPPDVVNLHRVMLMGQDGSVLQPRRFIVWWADDTHDFTNDLDSSFNQTSTADGRVAGAVVVLDLKAAGSGLLEAAGAPLVYVTIKQGA